ncbi:substrate-binding domain-containing protein [Streptomyces thinghirensis]|nr:substrate-binding domain-containing protein [Streptomyces thinghirensis]
MPSEVGRSLSTRSTRRIGVIVTDLTNPFYPHVVAPLHDELESLGYRMMLLTERSDEAVAQENLLDQSLDGVVLATATTDSRLPAQLDRRDVHVRVPQPGHRPGRRLRLRRRQRGRRPPRGPRAREARAPPHRGHLWRRPTPPRGANGNSASAWLADRGIGLPEDRVVRGPFGRHRIRGPALPAGRGAAAHRVCGNDVVAVGVLNAARAAGLRVPGDLTVIGFDDLPTGLLGGAPPHHGPP